MLCLRIDTAEPLSRWDGQQMSASPHGRLPAEIHFGNSEVAAESAWIEIGNEFATVLCRRVMTRDGVRLQINVPRRELSIFLDVAILEGLMGQTPESLSRLFETPLEPLRDPTRPVRPYGDKPAGD